jgi:hypothetical protein
MVFFISIEGISSYIILWDIYSETDALAFIFVGAV